MVTWFRKWFAPPANPIGIDFGSDSLKMAQVQRVNGEHRLIAAASADVPSHLRGDAAARAAFFVQTVRDLLVQGNFVGRSAVLALPAAAMFIQHLRLPKMDEEATTKALPWEARGKLPIDPSQAVLRHLVAGEIYHDQEARQEIILMAAGREVVEGLLQTAAKARLDVTALNVEPVATLDCFAHVYRRKSDAEVTNCFVDIGHSGSRVFVARGGQMLFARTIGVGGAHMNRAVAAELGLSEEDARLLRLKLACAAASVSEHEQKQQVTATVEAKAVFEAAAMAEAPAAPDEDGFALLGAGLRAAQRREDGVGTAVLEAPTRRAPAGRTENEAMRVERACRGALEKLAEELDLCRRYCEATFPSRPVERLIFVGGEARNRSACQFLAQRLGLAAQVGDPLVRMGRISEIGVESGIDRRQPQPGWAVAIGLSMGPKTAGAAC